MISIPLVIEKLKTSDILFGSVYTNTVLLIVNLLQVFGSIVLISVFDKPFDIKVAWFFIVDGFRVLMAAVIRIESLLKEDENQRLFIRKALLVSNIMGLLLSFCVFIFIFTIISKDNFWFELVAGALVLVHFGATVPALTVLFKEPAETDPLLSQFQRLSEEEPVMSENGPSTGYNPPPDVFSVDLDAHMEQQHLIYSMIQEQNQRNLESRSIVANQDLDFEQLEAEARMSQQLDNFAPLDDNSIQPTDDAGPAEVVADTKQITEPPKPAEEPEKSDTTVLLRLRLPDGKTLKRRFLKDENISNVHSYVDYELFQAGISVDKYQLVVTVPPPRTQYTDLSQSLEAAGLYHKSNRECVSPMIYVEDLS